MNNYTDDKNYEMDSLLTINVNANIYELFDYLTDCLTKLESLVTIMALEGLWELDKMVVTNYIWAIQGFTKQSIEVSEILFQKVKKSISIHETN